jgi:DNA-directed RNA polymerase subunit M/transcription elongation factor TFIIS
MPTSEHSAGEMSVDEYTPDFNMDSMGGRTADIAGGRKTSRPKIMLSAVVTCPSCGNTNKPEWVNKSRHGDNYATTMWCEQCGSLIAIWATHVEAQIVTSNSAKGH